MSRLVAAGLVLLLLAACGFRPIYSGGRSGEIVQELASIEIAPIADRSGQILRNQLFDRLNPFGRPAEPEYRLQVTLRESKQELAVRKTELATRANLRFAANFRLVRTDTPRVPVFTASSRIVTSYNILTSEYATLIAERNAREDALRVLGNEIASRLAAFLQVQPEP